MGEKKKTALTIAGSDCSGGAGIQADIKTMQANGVYAMSVITALTAQNTRGISGIQEVSEQILEQQLEAVFSDIFPDAVKIGMLGKKESIQVIAQKLKKYHARNIVIDPVMISTSGTRLVKEDAFEILQRELFPMAALLTPNIPETEVLADMRVKTEKDMIEAAEKITEKYGCAVLCKGGHKIGNADDLLLYEGMTKWFSAKRVENPNTHGTGCTLSSAIAANLAKGYALEEAVERAKNYISGALQTFLDLGEGNGPLDHGYAIESVWKE